MACGIEIGSGFEWRVEQIASGQVLWSGGISKQGSLEGQAATLEYARKNPGLAQLLMSVAGRSGARWLARKFGVPKDMADQMAGLSMSGNLQALMPPPKGNSGQRVNYSEPTVPNYK